MRRNEGHVNTLPSETLHGSSRLNERSLAYQGMVQKEYGLYTNGRVQLHRGMSFCLTEQCACRVNPAWIVLV